MENCPYWERATDTAEHLLCGMSSSVLQEFLKRAKLKSYKKSLNFAPKTLINSGTSHGYNGNPSRAQSRNPDVQSHVVRQGSSSKQILMLWYSSLAVVLDNEVSILFSHFFLINVCHAVSILILLLD